MSDSPDIRPLSDGDKPTTTNGGSPVMQGRGLSPPENWPTFGMIVGEKTTNLGNPKEDL